MNWVIDKDLVKIYVGGFFLYYSGFWWIDSWWVGEKIIINRADVLEQVSLKYILEGFSCSIRFLEY